jgi:cell division septum initiation protein DivIVA
MLGIDLTLSLSREAMMAHHRQHAARMNRVELAQLADELIQRAHQQEHLIMELQRAAANLMVELALAGPPVPSKREPEERHLEMARELLWPHRKH